MYLKSVEVHGFKSFANKIRFDFHNGITGIVGPNGSGKSNIADAVRWVLGEQKIKQIRSTSMQDVIFSGTESRKPQSYAYVSLTLDNSDGRLPLSYQEVTVARRVYRSGESEYLLNGSVCRLKDVHELFYDTGIGKEGYSIIGQGQIDKILSGKPEERRELFDEAAGIVKFKRRKLSAQKNLDDEHQNLLRVNDILTELERQIAPLERQSESAKKYLSKKEELKAYDVNMFLLDSERCRTDLETLSGNIQIATGHQEELLKQQEEIRIKQEGSEKRIADMDSAAELLREEINEAVMKKEKFEGQINVLNEQIRAAEQSGSQLQQRLAVLREDMAKKQDEQKLYESEKVQLESEMPAILDEKESVTKEWERIKQEIAECESMMEAGKQEIIQLLNERASLKAGQQRYATMLEQANIRKSQLNQQLLTSRTGEADADAVMQQQLEALNGIESEIKAKTERKEDIEHKLNSWERKFAQATTESDSLKEQFHKESSRLESLRNIAERYDGYGNGIRRVMEQKAKYPGIHGVVADIIKVEKQYETAIETALGGSIQNIVTEDEETAKAMIAFLKQNRYGRATFLPLTSIARPDRVTAEKALGENGVIGLADSLVSTEERFRSIAAHLLGRVLVVDNIDNAVALERKFRYSLRIVTLEGESLQPGGSMTGGAFRNNSNFLGRNREIEALEKSIQEIRKKSSECRERMEEIRTAAVLLKEELGECIEQIQQLTLSKNTAEMNLEHTKLKKEQQEAVLDAILRENSQIDGQISEIRAGSDKVGQNLKDSLDRESEINQEFARLQAILEKKDAELETVSGRMSQVSLRESQAMQKLDFAKENLVRTEQDYGRLISEQERLTDDSQNGLEHAKEKQIQIEEIRKLILFAEEECGKLSEKRKGIVSQKEEMTAECKGFFDIRESISKNLTELDKEMFRLNSKKEQSETNLEAITSALWDEYELAPNAAKEYRKDEFDSIPELKKLISGIREEIKALGPINVNAIEEFKDVSERYAFLSTQRNDLQEAEQRLQDIITELDEGMRRQFREKFEDVRNEFDKTFKELFGGGKGSLELSEEGDILECGISIIAQPPGKKLQNMMQLSGGEKALTAIALLFAIQNLKPSPFCLLDEIEAALDESNVERFAGYLHKLTKNTQFIIITHRRGTIAAADRLYGITMQEKGVSTLVSVKLIEDDLDD